MIKVEYLFVLIPVVILALAFIVMMIIAKLSHSFSCDIVIEFISGIFILIIALFCNIKMIDNVILGVEKSTKRIVLESEIIEIAKVIDVCIDSAKNLCVVYEDENGIKCKITLQDGNYEVIAGNNMVEIYEQSVRRIKDFYYKDYIEQYVIIKVHRK